MNKYKETKGDGSSILCFCFISVVFAWFFIVCTSYNVRIYQKNYISDCLSTTVGQVCKKAELTEDIKRNLRNKLNKMYKEEDYELTYKYTASDDGVIKDIDDDTILKIGDTFLLQFNLRLNGNVKKQPTFSYLVSKITGNEDLDEMLLLQEGMIENNYE